MSEKGTAPVLDRQILDDITPQDQTNCIRRHHVTEYPRPRLFVCEDIEKDELPDEYENLSENQREDQVTGNWRQAVQENIQYALCHEVGDKKHDPGTPLCETEQKEYGGFNQDRQHQPQKDQNDRSGQKLSGDQGHFFSVQRKNVLILLQWARNVQECRFPCRRHLEPIPVDLQFS